MPTVSFVNLLVVAAVAFAAPFMLGLLPRVRLPAVVLEIVAGIVLGPVVLGWVRVDLRIQILSTIGLAFLLVLAGMEIDLDRLRGRVLRLSALSFGHSFGLALIAAFPLAALALLRQMGIHADPGRVLESANS